MPKDTFPAKGGEIFVTFQNKQMAEIIYKSKSYNIIMEVKAVTGITDEFIVMALNYLRVSDNRLDLIVNFGELKLNYKKVVL